MCTTVLTYGHTHVHSNLDTLSHMLHSQGLCMHDYMNTQCGLACTHRHTYAQTHMQGADAHGYTTVTAHRGTHIHKHIHVPAQAVCVYGEGRCVLTFVNTCSFVHAPIWIAACA